VLQGLYSSNPDLIVAYSEISFCAKHFVDYYGVNSLRIYLSPTALLSNILPWPYRNLSKFYKRFYKLSQLFLLTYDVSFFKRLLNTFIVQLHQLCRRLTGVGNEMKRVNLLLFPEWFSLGDKYSADVIYLGFPLAPNYVDKNTVAPTLSLGCRYEIFTAGSFSTHEQRFFEVSAEYCKTTGIQGVFICHDIDQINKYACENILVFDFIDFSELLKFADLAIHHGGIGTISQCIAQEVPQIIVPSEFDQVDNGWRVSELGLGVMIFLDSYTVDFILTAKATFERVDVKSNMLTVKESLAIDKLYLLANFEDLLLSVYL
jgi:UDP:flavonoid glycosyltransferase YjiC (YdhE family)